MKSLLDLHLWVLEESGIQFGESTQQDRKTIELRVKHEGLSFLTITLPKLAKDLQRALADGQVASTHFAGFPLKGKLPLLFGGWFRRVFDPITGVLLDDPDVEAIRVLLQLTGMMKKVELECTEKRTKAAFDTYIEIENEVRKKDMAMPTPLLVDFRVWTHILFGDLLHSWQKPIVEERLIPKHGPGAVADRLRGNSKWLQPAWPDRLEQVFPFGRYAYSSYRHYLNDLDDGGRPSLPGTEVPVRVTAVPKTLETPRLIAIEPTCMQYMQQALKGAFEAAVRNSRFGQMIDYESQVPNQDMARRGSITGTLATLDLSEASDRVSNQLVRAMLSDFPELLEAVDATRSRSADVLGHGVIRLAKFASMGSALCFPIESMVFLIVVMMGCYEFYRSNTQDTPMSRRVFIKKHIGSVRTYGDDIIVPSKYAQSVSDHLELFGLKVNRTKSFWTGKFRESCGKEYFNGHDVTHVKVRAVLPTERMQASELATSLVKTSALRNHLFEYGYWQTCRKLDQLMEGFIPYPAVGSDSPAIGRLSSLGYQTERWDDDLQLPLVKACVVNVDPPGSYLDGYGALMKCLVKDSDFENPDPKHLLRAGRPSSLRIKKRWVRSY